MVKEFYKLYFSSPSDIVELYFKRFRIRGMFDYGDLVCLIIDRDKSMNILKLKLKILGLGLNLPLAIHQVRLGSRKKTPLNLLTKKERSKILRAKQEN